MRVKVDDLQPAKRASTESTRPNNDAQKMRKRLLVASSYHHVLTAIAKSFADGCPFDLLITNSWTDGGYWDECLIGLKKNKWFENVYFYDERSHRPPSPTNIVATYKYELKEELEYLRQIEGFDLFSYELIYLVFENMFPGATIVRNELPYVFIEDTTNVFAIADTAPTRLLRLSEPAIRLLFFVCRLLNYWHPIYGYASCCQRIEVSSLDVRFALPKDKFRLVDRKELISSIPGDSKRKILEMFLGDSYEAILVDEPTTLLLTSPILGADGSQMRHLCELLIKRYGEDERVVIKPHPRDTTDYSQLEGVEAVLPRSFPIEILDFDGRIRFSRAVTVGSTALESMTCVDEPIFIRISQILEILGE